MDIHEDLMSSSESDACEPPDKKMSETETAAAESNVPVGDPTKPPKPPKP